MLWTPKEHAIGDITIVRRGNEYHLFTEQTPLGIGDEFAGKRSVGHAVSKDLFRWEELPACLGCGPSGTFDAYTIYHMDVFVHQGTWHMYYTGLDKAGPGQQQAIGLATSPDGIAWAKHPANPILRADLRHYEPVIPREATYQDKDFGRLWFRDPCIIRNPATGEFGMVVIARDVKRHPDVRGCLAWATSKDLVRWEAHPPIYSPGRFHTIETPSLFERHGRHYIVFMTHPDWGTPVMTTDPYQNAGDFYAVSENGCAGPYRQPKDEVVIAAHEKLRMGAQRTGEGPDGERFLYGWLDVTSRPDDLQRNLTHTLVVPPPRRVRFLDDGEMHVTCHEKIESFTQPTEIMPEANPKLAYSEPDRWKSADAVVGKRFGGRTTATFPGQHDDFIWSVRLRFLHGERAGLVARADHSAAAGWYALADRRFGRIEFGGLGTDRFIDARLWQPRDEVELKIVASGPSVEVYADDRLMIHQVRHRETSGQVGYIVEQAEAEFSRPRLLQFTQKKETS